MLENQLVIGDEASRFCINTHKDAVEVVFKK